MYLPLKIAKRYLLSIKKTSFVSIIGWLALAGIAFGTAALVIVLSVFNGLEDLNRSLFKSYDADLTIMPVKGKTFDQNLVDIKKIQAIESVKYTNACLEDNALLRYNTLQSVGKIKGVEHSFLKNTDFAKSIVEGKFALQLDSNTSVLLGIGLQQSLLISVKNNPNPIEFWYPKSNANLTIATEDSFNKNYAYVAGVFSIEQAYDNIAIVPIQLARELFGSENEISSLEISLKDGVDLTDIKRNITAILPQNLKVLDRDEQHIGLLKAIKFEKLFVYLALICITAVASLNLFFSLTMLVIEKRKDIATLSALGANKSLIKASFKNTGYIIGLLGIGIGLCLGFVFCKLQQLYGFLKMGMESALVDAYPVRMTLSDFLATGLGILLISIFIVQFPARKAAELS